MPKTLALLFTLLVSSTILASELAGRRDYNWHQWRGPRADGVAAHADPPTHWNEKTNITWKVGIPGHGSATPIVWEDRIFVLTAIETDRAAEDPPEADARSKTRPPEVYFQFVVLCLERASGKTIWRQVAREAVPHEGRHPTNTFASASPTTNGQYVYASFGSRGIYCFDFDGKMIWHRNLGNMRTRYGWGEATSPVLHEDSLVVNWDHEDQSFITVLDAQTGKTKWKVDRDEPTSWATPLVVKRNGRLQTIVNGTNRVRSYDLDTGEVIWECGGQTVNAIPSPIVSDNIVYCLSGYRGSAAYAIRLDASGDITDKKSIVWSYDQGTPYVPSPIVYDGQIYFTRSNTAILSCLDAKTGKPIFVKQRMPGLYNLYASPVAAADRLYFVGRDGTTIVIRHGAKLDVLATNRIDDHIDASPALVGKQLFLRGSDHLYCIESK